jgi:hypothetical protein
MLVILIIGLVTLIFDFEEVVKEFLPFYIIGMGPHLLFSIFTVILMARKFRTQFDHPYGQFIFYTHVIINVALFFGQIISTLRLLSERESCDHAACSDYYRDILLKFMMASGLIDILLVAQPISFNRYTTMLERKKLNLKLRILSAKDDA